MPDSISPDQDPENLAQQNTREVINQSGGIGLKANDVAVGQDMTGRDKVVSVGGHIIHAEPGSTVIISDKLPIPGLIKPGNQGQLTVLISLSPVWLLIAIISAALAVVVGGLLWNIVNVLFKWHFYLGGSGNEPYGVAAFIWGIILALTISVIALAAGYRYIPRDWQSFRKGLVVIALYTLGGGLGAVIFYDSGVRRLVESANLGYGGQEVIIAVVWSFVLSISTYLPVQITHSISETRVDVLNTRYLALQIPVTTILVLLAVLVSLLIDRPETELSQLRGFFAGVALRLGLFLGLLGSIVMKWAVSQTTGSTQQAQQ